MKSEWEEVSISDVTINHDNKRIPISSRQRESRQGKYPYYGAQGIIDHIDEYIFDGEYLLVAEDGENLRSHRLPIAQIVNGRFWVNNHAHILTTNSKANLHYLCYILNNTDISGFITGSAQPKLSQSSLNAITVVLPSVKQQDIIVSILSCLDEKIKYNHRINDYLEQTAQAIFKNWFVDFGPWGGEMPDDWREGTISDLGDVIGGSTPSKAKPEYYTESGIAWITPKDLSSNKSKFIAHGADDITELGLRNSSARLMPRGTVLFSSRAPIGYIAIASGKVCTNQGFKSIVPKESVGTAFIYYFLIENIQTIENMASGSTFKEVSGTTMKGIPAIIPDTDTLRCFQAECALIFENQELLEAENVRLAALRDTLLPRLMSGELSVADIQAAK